MSTIDTVCVTGASGFVGSQIVADLLAQGYPVRGTVRDPSKAEKYSFLTELPGAADRLSLHNGQLLAEGSFDEALQGCDACIHTASPYVMDVKDPQRVPQFDSTKSKEVLDLTYRPIQETLLETVEDLKKWGHLKG